MTEDKELGLEPSENIWVVVGQLLEMEYHIDRRLPLASGDRKKKLFELHKKVRALRQEMVKDIFDSMGIKKEDAEFVWCILKHNLRAWENMQEYVSKKYSGEEFIEALNKLRKEVLSIV